MNTFFELFIPALISNSVVALVITLIFRKRTEVIAAEVKNQFEQHMTVFRSGYQWKEKALAELFGPVNMQFNRTKRAFRRYDATNLFLEANVLKNGNETIRNLLLEKAYLIPAALVEDANRLVEHYDVWLEEFYKQRDSENPNLDQKFIFAGPQGYRFPEDAEAKFKTTYQALWNELYG